MQKVAGLAALLLLCTSAYADELDLSFNDDALRVEYVRDYAARDLQADLGLLNHSDRGSVFNLSLYKTGFAADGNNPPQAGIGLRSGYVDGDLSDQNGIPVAVGGFIKYTFPQNNRFSVQVAGWIAPDILTLGDLDLYQDFSVRLKYNVLREADVFIGARYVKAEFDNNSEVLFDNGMHIGLNFRF